MRNFRPTKQLLACHYPGLVCHKESRSQWPCGLRHGSAACRFLGLWVRIPPGACMSISCKFCVCCYVDISASSLSLLQRKPTACAAYACHRETSIMRWRWPTRSYCTIEGKCPKGEPNRLFYRQAYALSI